jgi:hypothetical protein
LSTTSLTPTLDVTIFDEKKEEARNKVLHRKKKKIFSFQNAKCVEEKKS